MARRFGQPSRPARLATLLKGASHDRISRSTRPSRKQVHTPAEAEIRAIFAHRNPRMPARTLTPLAKLVANFTDVVAGLAVDQREKIPTSKIVLRDILLRPAGLRTEPGADEPKNVAMEPAVERHTGTGLRDLLSLEVGRQRLAWYVQSRPLESWAGPVAGPGEIEKQLHVARSTLKRMAPPRRSDWIVARRTQACLSAGSVHRRTPHARHRRCGEDCAR